MHTEQTCQQVFELIASNQRNLPVETAPCLIHASSCIKKGNLDHQQND